MRNRKSLAWGLFFIVLLSFVFTQLTNDFIVFWAYGRLVYNSDSVGINALIDPWELKGLLYKAYLALSYDLTSVFSTDFSLICQSLYKFWGCFLFLPFLGIAVRVIPKQYISNFGGKLYFWCFLSVILLAVHFISHFQPEMWGVLFLLISFSLYLRDDIYSSILAAIVFCLSFYLKSPMPLLGGTLFFGGVLLRENSFKEELKRIIPFAITTLIFLPLTLVAMSKFYPQELVDIWGASYYQNTLFHSGTFLRPFFNLGVGFVKGLFYNPVILLGAICTIIACVKSIRERNYLKLLYFVLLWSFPLIYVLISNCFFMYHYYTLAFPAIIAIIYLMMHKEYLNDIIRKRLLLYYLGFYFLFLSAIAPTNVYAKYKYSKIWQNINEQGYCVGDSIGNNNVLYLDDGRGAFLFSNKTYLRYFYPLPLQRIQSNNPFVESETYKDVKMKALSYQGDYITLFEDWFYKGNNDDIKAMIESKYELIDVVDIPDFSLNFLKFEIELGPLKIYKKR